MSTSPKPWKFRRISLGPGLPEVDIEPLDLPPTEPTPTPTKAERCWFCLGCGQMGGFTTEPVTCEVCGGSGQIGGQS